MAKKNQDNKRTSIDSLAMQQFFEKLDEVERESRASDIGVVDDMYRYTGEEEPQQQAATPAPEGVETGNEAPAEGTVPEPPKGGPEGEASGSRPLGRRRSVRMPQVTASDGAAPRLNLTGADVPRIKRLLAIAKLTNGKGSNAKIILYYLERGINNDYPELMKAAEKQWKKE